MKSISSLETGKQCCGVKPANATHLFC